MLSGTLARPVPTAPGVAAPPDAVARAAQALADAVAEFDAALDEGRPMPVLVALDREVVATGRRHRAALHAARPA